MNAKLTKGFRKGDAETLKYQPGKIINAILFKIPAVKKILFACFILLSVAMAMAQDPKPAEKGVSYREGTSADGAVQVSVIESKMNYGKYNGKVTGKILSVCQEKGCWMKMEKPTGEAMMVKFKDYGFFMPKDIVGKEVVLDGEATVKETPINQLKHYAADAKKSKAEISKINKLKKELIFVANGVLVM